MLSSALFFVHFVVALVHAIPTRSQKQAVKEEMEEKEAAANEKKNYWMELDRMSQAPNSPMFPPMTPRTVAFNTLDGTMSQKRQTNRDLPLRHHIAMGEETFQGKGDRFA